MDDALYAMQTIAEMPEFTRRSEHLRSTAERQDIIDYLANFPKAGVLIEGTGGIRKLRWSRQDSGKNDGVRVIYYFHNERMPLYLFTVFGKGEKANLSKAERNELAKLVRILVQTWSTKDERSI